MVPKEVMSSRMVMEMLREKQDNLAEFLSLTQSEGVQRMRQAASEIQSQFWQDVAHLVWPVLPFEVTEIEVGNGQILRRRGREEGVRWDLRQMDIYGERLAKVTRKPLIEIIPRR